MALINEIEFKNGLNDIGNAIREKTGGTELIPFKEMASAIRSIGSDEETTNSIPVDTLYNFYGVNKTDYPCVFVIYDSYKKVCIVFTSGYKITSAGAMFLPNAPHLYGSGSNVTFSDYTNVESAITIAMEKVSTLTTLDTAYNYSGHIYTNIDISECGDTFYSLNVEVKTVRTEIELHNASDVWYSHSTTGDKLKGSDGWAIVGYAETVNSSNQPRYTFYIVAETMDSLLNTSGNRATVDYNGKTYHFNYTQFERTRVASFGKCVQIPFNTSNEQTVKDLLDYYYMVE